MPKKKTETVDPEVSYAAAALGSTGGKSGTGDSKRRDPNHYSLTLAEARRTAITRRKLS